MIASKRFIASILRGLICLVAVPLLVLVSLIERWKPVSPEKRPRLFWGCDPLINIKYWSEALSKDFVSKTCVYQVYSINREEDFDLVLFAGIPKWADELRYCLGMQFALRNFDIFHIPFNGGALSPSCLAFLEPWLYRIARKKVVICPYGGDVYSYKYIRDMSLQHALQISYPEMALKSGKIERRLRRWIKYADFVLGSVMSPDGVGRWDIMVPSYLAIDTDLWKRPVNCADSGNNGRDGPVCISHSPNHRGVKGTEYIEDAVRRLRDEGLDIQFLLIEGMPNSEVRQMLGERTDILVEQLIMQGHGMNGLEGMALGIPVISNLSNLEYTQVLRRYSFLDECPVVSASPETIYEVLRILVTNPGLRKALGEAGQLYAARFHSYDAARYLFGSIYRKIWYGEDLDLINLYHPLIGELTKELEPIKHPLKENQLPC